MNLNTLKEVTRAHLPSLEERIGREMESGTASLIYRDENITHQLLPPHTHTHTHTHSLEHFRHTGDVGHFGGKR